MNEVKPEQLKKASHTPGPWQVDNHQDCNHHVINPGKCGNWIAVIQHNGEKYVQEQEANARLIAAAPDLLAALKPVIDAVCHSKYSPEELSRERDSWNPDAHIEMTLRFSEVMAAMDAIAQAEAAGAAVTACHGAILVAKAVQS